MDSDDDREATKNLRCEMCGNVGLDESNGFYYCQDCGAQANDIILTGVADEDFVDKSGAGAFYSARHTRHSQQPLHSSQTVDPSSRLWNRFTQEEEEKKVNFNAIQSQHEFDKLTIPEDFAGNAKGGLELKDYYNEVRIHYVCGMQLMVQLQCEALVEKFSVSPLICGIAGSAWLRFVAGSGVFKDDLADEFESQELVNDFNKGTVKPAVTVWFRQLRKMIPLSSSLAICFLACHVAREAILPNDIVKWSLEGKLPYYTAHVEIDERLGLPSAACPINSRLMFRPSQTIPLQKLESMAARIAESIGLHLPPVNFYEIASRYLKKLSLPVNDILPNACRIYEWSMPPDLWLSSNELRLPTRVCVLSILIVAIRILYDINGFGAWERSLSCDNESFSRSNCIPGVDPTRSSPMNVDVDECSGSPNEKMDDLGEESAKRASFSNKSNRDAEELLHKLEASYDQIGETLEYTKDLPSYLQYCKDVVFAGIRAPKSDNQQIVRTPNKGNHEKAELSTEEEELIEKLWDLYQNGKESEPLEEPGEKSNTYFNEKRLRDDNGYIKNSPEKKKIRNGSQEGPVNHFKAHRVENSPQKSVDDHHSSDSSEQETEEPPNAVKDRAIRRLKLDMEDNRFCYIPPRVNIKRLDYLHCSRKNDDGAYTYAAHADYYILLCACAKVAEVDIRIMHNGVLSFEKRLAWLEKRIDHCLRLTPPSLTCEFCGDVPDSEVDPLGLSQLSL